MCTTKIVTVAVSFYAAQAFNGVYEDKSGPEMAKLLTSMSDDHTWPLNLIIKHTAVVPDEPGYQETRYFIKAYFHSFVHTYMHKYTYIT